ncbi:MAG: NAD-dependent epimerase/dehydratase family protein [Planctomycetota bacterium]
MSLHSREFLGNSRIAITGATGFIGGRLARAILAAAPAELRMLTRRPLPADLGPRAVAIPGGLEDEEALRRLVSGADLVLHLAGATRAWSERDFAAVNADAVGRLAELARVEASPRRFVLVSSLAAAGPSTTGRPRREEDPCAPVSRYGASKLAGERALREAANGLSWTILRPPAVYGPGERDILEMFRMASRGWLPRLGWRRREFSFVYVDDLVRAIVEAAAAPACVGGTYFAAHPEVVDSRAFAAAIAGALPGRVRSFGIPSLLPRALGTLAGLSRPFLERPPLLNPDRAREMAPRSWVCDPSLLRRDAGWEPRVEMAEGAKLTAAWARETGQL